MKEDLQITLVQSHLHWEDKETNLNMFQAKLEQIPSSTDIIVLPEMFSTGFTMNAAAMAENMQGKTVMWMQEMAKKHQAVITGSLIINNNEKFYNRLIWAQPDGIILHYDKRHLFSMADEDKTYTAGNTKLIVNWKGWKICPLICFDLRFPVWSRNTESYDLLMYTANWPERRIQHWNKLLYARAIENQCFVIGLNRIGEDATGMHYTGQSVAIDPMGEHMFEPHALEANNTVILKHEEIVKLRRYMQFLKEQDQFTIL